jgi:DNA-damage-inducible protein J
MPKVAVSQKRSAKPAPRKGRPSRAPARGMGAVVRARIDRKLKDEAEVVLSAIGLDTSTAFRLMMTRIAEEKSLPFELLRPNAATLAAIRELRAGEGKKFGSFETMITDINEDD